MTLKQFLAELPRFIADMHRFVREHPRRSLFGSLIICCAWFGLGWYGFRGGMIVKPEQILALSVGAAACVIIFLVGQAIGFYPQNKTSPENDQEDRHELAAAKKRNGDKPGIALRDAARELDL